MLPSDGLAVWPCISGDCLRLALKIGFFPAVWSHQKNKAGRGELRCPCPGNGTKNRFDVETQKEATNETDGEASAQAGFVENIADEEYKRQQDEARGQAAARRDPEIADDHDVQLSPDADCS